MAGIKGKAFFELQHLNPLRFLLQLGPWGNCKSIISWYFRPCFHSTWLPSWFEKWNLVILYRFSINHNWPLSLFLWLLTLPHAFKLCFTTVHRLKISVNKVWADFISSECKIVEARKIIFVVRSFKKAVMGWNLFLLALLPHNLLLAGLQFIRLIVDRHRGGGSCFSPFNLFMKNLQFSANDQLHPALRR